MLLKDIMTPDVESVSPGDTLEQAARKMQELDVGPLPPEATPPASRSPSCSTANSESSSLPAFATSSQAPSSLRTTEPCEAR